METPLDQAHAVMTATPDDDAARLGFYARLAETGLFVLLAAEPLDDRLDPQIFPADGTDYVLAFDTEDRLAAFAGRPVPYAALPGRVVAALLAGRGLGLGLNLGAASETLLPAASLGWLIATLETEALERTEARPLAFAPPGKLPERLVEALSAALSRAAGLAGGAWLVGVEYDSGARGHLLAIVDARPEAEAALARAVSEALVFSGVEAGTLDVAFREGRDPALGRIVAVGRAFAVPAPPASAAPEAPKAPGSDPDRPPRLR